MSGPTVLQVVSAAGAPDGPGGSFEIPITCSAGSTLFVALVGYSAEGSGSITYCGVTLDSVDAPLFDLVTSALEDPDEPFAGGGLQWQQSPATVSAGAHTVLIDTNGYVFADYYTAWVLEVANAGSVSAASPWYFLGVGNGVAIDGSITSPAAGALLLSLVAADASTVPVLPVAGAGWTSAGPPVDFSFYGVVSYQSAPAAGATVIPWTTGAGGSNQGGAGIALAITGAAPPFAYGEGTPVLVDERNIAMIAPDQDIGQDPYSPPGDWVPDGLP